MKNEYCKPIIEQIPRLLSQVDRNPYSPTYGCCTRGYWHHRLTDLPNSQAQGLVLTLALVFKYKYPNNIYFKSDKIKEWIFAIMDYWTKIQHKNGSFDEVYINQDSFAATTFTSYSISESLLELGDVVPINLRSKLVKALCKSGDWLIRTRESIAMNQTCSSITTLYNIYLLTKNKKYLNGVKKKLAFVIKNQNPEGWLNEYGKADIGYSFLALDYLAKYYHKTKDQKIVPVVNKLLAFLKYFVHEDGSIGGLYGSRNTEYLLPHGLELFSRTDKKALNLANFFIYCLDKGIYSFMRNCVDDRYFMYLSANYLQAYNYFNKRKSFKFELPLNTKHRIVFRNSGLVSYNNGSYHIVLNYKKGGVFQTVFRDFSYTNAGLFGVTHDNRVVSTQQISDGSKLSFKNDELVVEGNFFAIPKFVSKPFNLLAIKLFNMLAPSILRKFFLDNLRKFVVNAKPTKITYRMKIKFGKKKIKVEYYINSKIKLKTMKQENRHIAAMHFASSSFYIPQEMMFFHNESPDVSNFLNEKGNVYLITIIDVKNKIVKVDKIGSLESY